MRRSAGTTDKPGETTVKAFSKKWMERRWVRGLADAPNDQARLRDHILPAIGDLELTEVRPRHLIEMVDRLRFKQKLAPEQVRHMFPGTVVQLFRSAKLAKARS